MPITISSALDWVRRRAENIVAGLLGIMFVAFLLQIVFRYFFNFPDRLDVRAVRHRLAVHDAAGLRLLAEGERRDPLRPHFRQAGPARAARRRPRRRGRRAVVLFGMALPATVELRDVHEGREHVVPQHPPRPPVLGLRRLRGGRRSSATCGRSSACCAARRRKRSTSPRRAPDYEPHQPVLPRAHRHLRPEPVRAARRLRDDRRLDPLAVPVGPRHGDRGRAAAERHDGEPAAARHPAVHPRRRVHEHRQHHGQAAALLQRDRRALPRRARAGQRGAEHHLRQHVGLRARRRRGLRQADAVADDARRQVHARLRGRADHACRRSSGRSCRRRSRWCSTRWYRTRRSATCSSAA